MTEREEFEAWYTAPRGLRILPLAMDGVWHPERGDYTKLSMVQAHWETWQAARKKAASPERVVIQGLVEILHRLGVSGDEAERIARQ